MNNWNELYIEYLKMKKCRKEVGLIQEAKEDDIDHNELDSLRQEIENQQKEIEELKQMMKDDPIEMAIFFPDTAIDYESRKNPTPTYINYVYKSIEFNFFKKTETFISSVEFKNDENLLFENEHTKIDTMLDRISDSSAFIEDRVEEENNLLGQFIIQASQKQIQVSRSYQKLPSFLADFTEILQEILFILLLIINFLEWKTVDLKLIRKMLKYKGSKYYDVDYLITTFKQQLINKNVKESLNKKENKSKGKSEQKSQKDSEKKNKKE